MVKYENEKFITESGDAIPDNQIKELRAKHRAKFKFLQEPEEQNENQNVRPRYKMSKFE